MAISLDAFLYAITSNETSHIKNPYSAVGPPTRDGNRAYGKYQIMDFNIPVWSKQYLGRRISLQEYRNNPNIQEQLARAVLTDYYNKYGAEGAAAKWFSGEANPNSNASDGHWTVRQYVAEMQKAAAKYSGQGSGGGSGSWMPWDSGKSGGSTPSIDPSVLAEEYGLVKQLVDSVPEIKNLFNQAVAGGWDAKKFQARLANTTWWKTHNEKQRQYLIKAYTDPASFQDDRENAKFRIGEIANQVGVWAAINNTKMMNDLVWNVLYNGWSDAELKFHLANVVSFTPEGNLGGAGGEFQQKMASQAWANGVKLDNNWYLNYYRMILQGVSTEQQALQDIRNKAAARFPGFRDQIMAGQNMVDIASPYMQGMSSILEINPGSLDLFDPTITGALNYKDDKGVTGAKPLWQFEVELRKDPRWVQTSNAREGLMGVAHKVAQDFGVLF